MSTLNISVSLVGDKYQVTGNITPGGDLPTDIFAYENTGSSELGTFCGITSKSEFTQFQTWQGTAIPVFGNRFVKYGQIKINVSLSDNVDEVISNLVSSISEFAKEYRSNLSENRTYNI